MLPLVITSSDLRLVITSLSETKINIIVTNKGRHLYWFGKPEEPNMGSLLHIHKAKCHTLYKNSLD